jgi:hypothetical protein
MNHIIGTKFDMLTAGVAVVHAITSPKCFFSGFLGGSLIGTVVAVGFRILNGPSPKKSYAENEVDQISVQENSIIKRDRYDNNYFKIIRLACAGLNVGLYYVYSVHRAVSSIFIFLGGLSAICVGVREGILLGHVATNKIITLKDNMGQVRLNHELVLHESASS